MVYEDYAELMTIESLLKKVGFDVIGLTSEYSVSEQVLAFNPDLVVGCGREGSKVGSIAVGKRLKEMPRWQGKVVLVFPAKFKPNPQDLIRLRVDMILESPVAPDRLVQVVGKLLGQDEAALLEKLGKNTQAESPELGATTAVSGTTSQEAPSIYVQGSAAEELPEDADKGESKFAFRFGDKQAPAVYEGAERRGAGQEHEVTFADVDLQALEQELLGGGVPEVERVETDNSDVRAKALKDLQVAEQSLKSRMAKYTQLVEDVKISPKSSVTRVEARRRQNLLKKEWDPENLKELDRLRREYTTALFKK